MSVTHTGISLLSTALQELCMHSVAVHQGASNRKWIEETNVPGLSKTRTLLSTEGHERQADWVWIDFGQSSGPCRQRQHDTKALLMTMKSRGTKAFVLTWRAQQDEAFEDRQEWAEWCASAFPDWTPLSCKVQNTHCGWWWTYSQDCLVTGGATCLHRGNIWSL